MPCSAARLALATALAALVVGAAACGGSRPASASDGTTTRAAFAARVDAVCAPAVRRHAGHPFPVPGFDPEHPDPAQLPAVGDYFARYGGLAETTHALHALTPPAAAGPDWRSLLTVADRMVANAQRQIAAAEARDTETFVQTVHTAPDLVDQLNAAAKRLGFRSTSPCAQVFG